MVCLSLRDTIIIPDQDKTRHRDQASRWYQSLDDMIASAKTAGDVMANATVQDLAGLKSVLLSLQEKQGTADTTD